MNRIYGPKIRFSETWDKIDAEHFKVGAEFSTWRPDNPERMAYHRGNIGKAYMVEKPGGHRDQCKGRAMLMSVGKEARNAMEFTDAEIAKDTYADWTKAEWSDWLQKMYGPTFEILTLRELTFKIVEVNGH